MSHLYLTLFTTDGASTVHLNRMVNRQSRTGRHLARLCFRKYIINTMSTSLLLLALETTIIYNVYFIDDEKRLKHTNGRKKILQF